MTPSDVEVDVLNRIIYEFFVEKSIFSRKKFLILSFYPENFDINSIFTKNPRKINLNFMFHFYGKVV